MSKLTIYIDNQPIKTSNNKKVLEVALQHNFDIPHLCYHPDLKAKANCRLCMVKIKGKSKLTPACATPVQDGMEIFTETPKIRKLRKINLKLLLAEHIKKCPTCVYRLDCKLLDLAVKYKIKSTDFDRRKEERKTYTHGNSVQLDNSQCIDCRNCLEVCSLQQNIGYLKLQGRGIDQKVKPEAATFWEKLTNSHPKPDCIYCGQCALHCPVGAAQEKTQLKEVQNDIKDTDTITIAQFAPSLRVSIGEEFGYKPGTVVTKKLTTALKKLGFDYVFDVNFGADVTTMIEAQELLERVKNQEKLPMMTSCCPGWVKYIETYHPELIPNLTTARSPHIHLGSIIKTYWAQKFNIDPDKIRVVSIMPCTAKKFEANRGEMKIQGNYPVDRVLTTRETAWLLHKNKLDLNNITKTTKPDPILTTHSGAGAIYGGTGGVMESALRTAQYLAGQSQQDSKLNFKQVRGLKNVKESEITINDKILKVAVVNGVGNVEPVLEKLSNYDYIEVMTCPGGCIGGGGQPVPTTKDIRQQRIRGLYNIDEKKELRKAHQNKYVQDILDWSKHKKSRRKIFYTKYFKR